MLAECRHPSLAFIAMNPFSLHPSYQPLLSSEELREMEVKDSHALCYYVLCVVREPVQESTLNFKCPVVVNPDSRRAIQVILESDAYHMRHRLAEFQGGKAGTLC
ncbi:MAG: flagellar assembly protein FliW [Flavonifractor plautii]